MKDSQYKSSVEHIIGSHKKRRRVLFLLVFSQSAFKSRWTLLPLVGHKQQLSLNRHNLLTGHPTKLLSLPAFRVRYPFWYLIHGSCLDWTVHGDLLFLDRDVEIRIMMHFGKREAMVSVELVRVGRYVSDWNVEWVLEMRVVGWMSWIFWAGGAVKPLVLVFAAIVIQSIGEGSRPMVDLMMPSVHLHSLVLEILG